MRSEVLPKPTTSMNPGDVLRRTPPPLLSTSLAGLEQVVPPDRPFHSSLGPSWKFKPLPDLPSRISGVCGGNRGGKATPISPNNHLVAAHRDNDVTPIRRRVEVRNQFPDGHTNQQHIPCPSGQGPKQKQSTGARRVQEVKRPASYSREGQWTLFPSQKRSPSPNTNQGPAIITPNARQNRSKLPPSPTSPNLAHPSLVPDPLAVDGFWKPDKAPTPPLPTPDSSEFWNYHLPHPQCHDTVSGVGCPRSCTGHQHQGSKPSPTAHYVDSRQNIAQERNTCPERIENPTTRQSVGSDFPNRTQLYSFSTTSSTGNQNTYNDDSNTNDAHDGIHKDISQDAFPLNRAGQSYTPEPPSHPRHTCPFVKRPKQLAIPPTDYQKHGPKVWSLENKQHRAELFPRCVRRFLPQSWRQPEDNNKKKTKNRKKDHINGKEKPVTFRTSPLPPPPRPPRPPSSRLPLRAAAAPPSLPNLNFPCSLDTGDCLFPYTNKKNDTSTTPTPAPVDRPPATPWKGLTSVSTCTLSREEAGNASRRVEHVAVGETKTDIKRTRSEDMLAVRRRAPTPLVVDRRGNYWV